MLKKITFKVIFSKWRIAIIRKSFLFEKIFLNYRKWNSSIWVSNVNIFNNKLQVSYTSSSTIKKMYIKGSI